MTVNHEIKEKINEEALAGKEIALEGIYSNNVITGDKNHLYYRLKESFKRAEKIDIIVSFLMESGVKLLLEDLKEALSRDVKIRILTGNYLNITQPQALYLLKDKLGDKIDLRFYNVKNKSFHPKSYIFHSPSESEIYIGSSNISRGALTSSIEWNYRFAKAKSEEDFNAFCDTFEDLFENHSQIIDDEVLRAYSASWVRPNVQKDLDRMEAEETEAKVRELFEPRGAQIEALYALKQSREEGYDKGLVVAATGIGKTYLAAFDSKEYNRVLFVAHREEIIKQAATSFRNVRNSEDMGFFYSDTKDTKNQFIFALVRTLGKSEYLNEEYFPKDYFDYIVVDEFHHAVSNNYKNIIDYFKPKFMLGLTATPERLDSKDVFALCDYNSVYEVRLKDAINKGWLVPFRYYGIYDETVQYEDIEFKNGKYNDKQLEAALNLEKRGELILKHYHKYNSKKAMGFCSTRGHAEFMAKHFSDNGVTAVAVYSGEMGEYS
ncbi:MAG: DEAD/DEAH box helicase family protein, partial [Clostridium sp.]